MNPNSDPAALRAAPMAELLHRPTSEAAQSVTEDLLGSILAYEGTGSGSRERRRTHRAELNLKATISALLRDLLEAAPNADSKGFCFRPERSPDFTGTLATLRQYTAVRDGWLRESLIERIEGIRHGREFEGEYTGGSGRALGLAPRLRATEKLLVIAAEHGITPENLKDHFERSYDTAYPVVLRRKLDGPKGRGAKRRAKQSIRYKRTPETDRIAKEVNAINGFLADQTYHPSIEPRFVAIYGEDKSRLGELVWGGRLTSSGQNSFQVWSPSERRALTINGEPVADIDIKASHLTIYLAHLGVERPEGVDPYFVPDIPRLIVKRLVTVFFGNGHLVVGQWPAKLAEDYKAETGRNLKQDFKLQDVVGRIIKAIPALKRLTDRGLAWGELQRIEAGILRETLTTLRAADIPALPVHDSILVPESKVDIGQAALTEAFRRATGVVPVLVVKHADEELLPWTESNTAEASPSDSDGF